jgi:hypothetical protein
MKVGFILLSARQNPLPSTRIAVLNMLPYLAKVGIQTEIVYEPDSATDTPTLSETLSERVRATGCDLVVFQRVRGPSAVRLVKRLSSEGVKTAYMVCDLVDTEMAEATDGTLAVTEFLRSLHPANLWEKVHVVHDGIERPDVVKSAPSSSLGTTRQPLRAVLVSSATLDALPILGYPPEWLRVTIVGRYPARINLLDRINSVRWSLVEKVTSAERRAYLRFLLHPRIRRVPWDASGVYRHLLQADIGIIPVDVTGSWRTVVPGIPGWMSKSENRLSLMMSAGLPVIATPIPAYEAIVDHGRNGFLARNLKQWTEALELLRDPAARGRIGKAAHETVHRRFSMERQAELLVAALLSIAGRSCSSSERSI